MAVINIDNLIAAEVSVFLDWWEEHPYSTREEIARELMLFMAAKPDPLLLFCDPAPMRYNNGLPWTKNGVRYATDGRILVAIQVPGEADSTVTHDKGKVIPRYPNFPRYPNCEGLLKNLPNPREWKPLKDVGVYEDFDDGVCHWCMGFGAYHWHSRVAQAETCEQCGGTGSYAANSRCRIDGKAFSSHYLRRILEYAADAEYGIVQEETMRFRFNGGEGAVMAMHG